MTIEPNRPRRRGGGGAPFWLLGLSYRTLDPDAKSCQACPTSISPPKQPPLQPNRYPHHALTTLHFPVASTADNIRVRILQTAVDTMPPMVPQRGGPSGLKRPGTVSGKTIFGAGKTGSKRHRYVSRFTLTDPWNWGGPHGSHQTTLPS